MGYLREWRTAGKDKRHHCPDISKAFCLCHRIVSNVSNGCMSELPNGMVIVLPDALIDRDERTLSGR